MIKQPRCLVLDIETSPLLAYVWDLKDQNIALNQIKKDWNVLGWAAKWLGDPASKIIYHDQSKAKDISDDKAILEVLWKLLDEADIVITQNGARFDGPKLNARFIQHGMRPPRPYKHLDTYQIVSKVARFTSHKLEYLTAKLCTQYKKLSHKKFPGMTLWNECLDRNPEAWKEMRTYNIHDVLSTEELYQKIKAWAPETMARPFVVTDAAIKCGTCGEIGHMREGKVRHARKHVYRQHSCLKCGAWQKGEVVK